MPWTRTLTIMLLTTSFAACEKPDGNAPSPAGSAKSAESAAAPKSESEKPGAETAVSAASIDIKWTGKWKPGDAPNEEFPLYSVTNKAKTPLTYMQLWHYFYDKDKKQLGRAFTERYQLNIAPGGTEEIGAGPKKTEIPQGTEHIQAVVIGANFGSESVKFRDQPPAEQRAFSGG